MEGSLECDDDRRVLKSLQLRQVVLVEVVAEIAQLFLAVWQNQCGPQPVCLMIEVLQDAGYTLVLATDFVEMDFVGMLDRRLVCLRTGIAEIDVIPLPHAGQLRQTLGQPSGLVARRRLSMNRDVLPKVID